MRQAGVLSERVAFDIVGSSPEALVTVTDRHCVVHPIAGTRRRGSSAEEDAALAEELLADVKERAEHVMLVDLGRNDLGRVCAPGTVSVVDFMSVERYSHVMHLVSTVVGTLGEGRSAYDALAATFPAGTLSGAPKPRAMEIIDELEPLRRGLYGGIVGLLRLRRQPRRGDRDPHRADQGRHGLRAGRRRTGRRLGAAGRGRRVREQGGGGAARGGGGADPRPPVADERRRAPAPGRAPHGRRGTALRCSSLASGEPILLVAYAMPWGSAEVPGRGRARWARCRPSSPAATSSRRPPPSGWVRLAGIAGVVATRGWGRPVVADRRAGAGAGGATAAAALRRSPPTTAWSPAAAGCGGSASRAPDHHRLVAGGPCGGCRVVHGRAGRCPAAAAGRSSGARYERTATPRRELSAWQGRTWGRIHV